MNRIVVFCGSGIGTEPVFENVAKQLNQLENSRYWFFSKHSIHIVGDRTVF
jgi:galactitol-specific phosphotransferase system IIB component